MAPIPAASSAGGVMPALLASPWLKWSLLVVFAILLVSLGALTLVWIYGKTMKSMSMFIERLHERKLVLPTHLDSRLARPIVLSLPPCLASSTQTASAESLAVKNYTTGTMHVSEQFSLSLWLSTSLDHITLDEYLEREESMDEDETFNTPALSPSLDTDNDSDDSALQTPPLENTLPPVSLPTKDPAVVDDNYGSTADILGALAHTTAFTGLLCYDDLNVKSFEPLDCTSGDSLYGNDIPTIVISEELDDTCSRYPYESATLPSTPSTAALYTLGLPTTAHEYPEAPSTSPISPIPIPFSPTLSPDSYIYVPPPGSADYFLSFEPSSVQEDEPESDEEQLPDLSRLTSGSRNAIFDDSGSFDWNRLLAQHAELDQGQVGSGLRSAFSTDSDLASEDVEDDDEEDEGVVTAQAGAQGTSDWDRLGSEISQREEDSGLRSALSMDSDFVYDDDDEDEEDEDEKDEEDDDHDEEEEGGDGDGDEDEYDPDSDEAPPSNMPRLGLRSTSGNMMISGHTTGISLEKKWFNKAKTAACDPPFPPTRIWYMKMKTTTMRERMKKRTTTTRKMTTMKKWTTTMSKMMTMRKITKTSTTMKTTTECFQPAFRTSGLRLQLKAAIRQLEPLTPTGKAIRTAIISPNWPDPRPSLPPFSRIHVHPCPLLWYFLSVIFLPFPSPPPFFSLPVFKFIHSSHSSLRCTWRHPAYNLFSRIQDIRVHSFTFRFSFSVV